MRGWIATLVLGIAALACGDPSSGVDAEVTADVTALFETTDTDTDASPVTPGYVGCPADPEAEGPRPEPPRPDLCRADWKNLNGAWRFAFDPDDEGLEEGWYLTPARLDRTITVPFPWQSELSGVAEPDPPEGLGEGRVAWYAREFTVSEAWRERRVHLVFGAVDGSADVWVNGEPVGGHDGGYTPFRLDVTDALRDGPNSLVVRVVDPGNDPEHPHGKQGSPWYTNAGGLWQTVWLEAVPVMYVSALSVAPVAGATPPTRAILGVALDRPADVVPTMDRLDVSVWRQGEDQPLDATMSEVIGVPPRTLTFSLEIPVDDTWLWRPEAPNLVPLTVRICTGGTAADPARHSFGDVGLARHSLGDGGCDVVSTLVGLRTVSRDDVLGFNTNQVILLNGRPLYVRGVLMQGWNQGGLLTYPSDDAIAADLQAAKDAGFNLVRLHVKPEDPRVLHHADRLGLLVDADAVNLGSPPGAAGDSPAGRERWERTFHEQVARDRNHPSLLWWTLFHETWGLTEPGRPYDEERQQWVKTQVAWTKQSAPGALVEDMSPAEQRRDHVRTDLLTWHFHRHEPADVAAHLDTVLANVYLGSGWLYTGGHTQEDTYPLVNTGFGPFAADPDAGDLPQDRDVSDAFRWMVTLFRARPAISGYVFTALYDVELDRSGVRRYDRGAKQFGYEELMGCPMSALQGELFLGTDEVPDVAASPGGTVTLHPWLATYRPDQAPSALAWSLWPSGGEAPVAQGEVQLGTLATGRTDLPPLQVTLPGEGGVFVWRGRSGDACTYVPILAPPTRPEGWARSAPDAWTYTLPPSALEVQPGAGGAVDPVTADERVEAAGLLGPGTLTASLAIEPALLAAGPWASVTFELELAADQPGMPQTDDQPFPSDVRVSLGGHDLGTAHPADDWADARGVVSAHHLPRSGPSGGYGAWTTLTLTDPQALEALKTAAEAGPLALELTVDGTGGAMVYGARAGRFGIDPRLEVQVEANE